MGIETVCITVSLWCIVGMLWCVSSRIEKTNLLLKKIIELLKLRQKDGE